MEASVEREGITCGGNFIIDHLKTVDLWPEEGMLSIIQEEKKCPGLVRPDADRVFDLKPAEFRDSPGWKTAHPMPAL